ncbi:MAG: hypothetical protein ACRC20_10945 [Segniliparus sp.]|uniref:hypothetical protein n=1 Tax=Segniliparus sp. TaxID=2804064 RepID=UPI003F3716BD
MSASRSLRRAAALFAVALLVHSADHLRRGMGGLPVAVSAAGYAQLLLTAVMCVLVFAGHRFAPQVAAFLGFASAIGFSAAHLLPRWGFFSDSFVHAPMSAHVTAFSWTTALLEIGAGLALGFVGARAARSRPTG